MKLTMLKCENCGGPLSIDENNPGMTTCKYCGAEYVLDAEQQRELAGEQAKEQSWYAAPIPSAPPPTRNSDWGWYGWKTRLTAILVTFAVLLAIGVPNMINKWKSDHAELSTDLQTIAVTDLAGEGVQEEESGFVGVFADVAAIALDKPADELTEAELAKIQRLEYKRAGDIVRVGYSFEASYDKDLIWLEFPVDTTEIELSALTYFTGLKELQVAGGLSEKQLEGLALERIGCYSDSPGELADALGNVEQIAALELSGVESLEGLERFTGLERLSLAGDVTDMTALVNQKGLQSLSLQCDKVTDFSFLSVMDWLVELSVDSSAIRDIGFVKNMTNLQKLSIIDAGILHIDALEGNTTLQSLTLDSCDDAANFNAVSGLTGLTQLTLDVPYQCEQPDLSRLTNLTELHLDGMKTTGFLAQMPALSILQLRSCAIDAPSAFTGLTQLKQLQCEFIADDIDWQFVAQIPGLEGLDLSGIITYMDISCLFNIPTLKELNISGMECEIQFSTLTQNKSLETLKMDGIKLYTNVRSMEDGVVRMIDYDEVILNDHMDFLANYPNLKHLYVADNKLTQLGAIEGLQMLETLDINENFIANISGLSTLRNLHTLKCQGNPIENYRVLGENVAIIY